MSNIKDVCCKLASVKWSIASSMSFKLEPVIWLRVLVTLAYMNGRTYLRTVDDVMAIKPNFLTSMGYHIFLSMVLRARAELRYNRLVFFAIWQRSIDQVLDGVGGTSCILDDIIITGKNDQEHLDHVEEVLKKLQEHCPRENREKCEFFQKKVTFPKESNLLWP